MTIQTQSRAAQRRSDAVDWRQLPLRSAQTPKPDHVTLMLNWYAYSEHAPFFLGKARDYYAKEGIDLDIQEGRGSAVTAQAVAAGSVQFGYIDIPTMIKAASKGAPLKSVGVLLQTSPMAVMAFADKNLLKTPQGHHRQDGGHHAR